MAARRRLPVFLPSSPGHVGCPISASIIRPPFCKDGAIQAQVHNAYVALGSTPSTENVLHTRAVYSYDNEKNS